MSNISKVVILQIKNLKLWFKVYQGYSKVLDGVNLTVHQGEKVGIVGEAGCGKTTTVKSILGIVPEGQYVIPEGEILYKGKDVLKMSDRDLGQVRSKEISMIYQEPSAALNPVFTIGQQMMEVVKNSAQGKGKSKAEQKQMVLDAIRDVFIPDPERIFTYYPIQLSGGMKQRICIAMAIMTQRDLMIADEPGTALDVTIQDQVHKTLNRLVEERNMSLIMITHSLGVAREITDERWVPFFRDDYRLKRCHGLLLYRGDTPVACINYGPARTERACPVFSSYCPETSPISSWWRTAGLGKPMRKA